MVRQTAKRAKHPDVLTTQEVTALLRELPEPARTAVFVAVATGLRVSELLALKWSDVDFAAQIIKPSRGIVGQVVGGLKTEESAMPVPASEAVTDALLCWRGLSLYAGPDDYVFPSPKMGGKQPYWPNGKRYGRHEETRPPDLYRVNFEVSNPKPLSLSSFSAF
jgi:integrase